MLPYTIRQLVWMLTSALQLIYALSTGVVWVLQMVRLFAYGACVGVCFIPHWWWYLTSPNIIRRVSYRSSEATKRRDILRVLEAEGADLHEVLHTDTHPVSALPPRQRPLSPLPSPSAGAAAAAARRRRRVAAAAHAESAGRDGGSTLSGSGPGGPPFSPRQRPARGGAGGPHTPSRRRRPLPTTTSAAAHAEAEPGNDLDDRSRSRSTMHDVHQRPYSVDGEVDDGALSQLHPVSPGCLAAQPHTSRRASGRQLAAGLAGEVTPHDRAANEYEVQQDDTSAGLAHTPVRRRRRPPPPPPPSFAHGGASGTRRGGGGGAPLRSTPTPTSPCGALTQTFSGMSDAAGLGEAWQQQQPPRRSPAQRHRRRSATQESIHSEDPRQYSAGATCGLERRQSSSSSGGTANQPSPAEQRGVGGAVGDSADDAAEAYSQHSSGQPTQRDPHARPAPARPSVFEGHALYYDALPKVDVASDPLLRDVLAAVQEAEASDLTTSPSQGERLSGASQRLRRQSAGAAATPAAAAAAAARRPRRRSGGGAPRPRPPPPPPSVPGSHAAASRTPPPPQQQTYTRTPSEDQLLAGVDEDEEDRMNLHNRATVDIVLPVPLDSLMRTLEYAQQSKRLRRKRFPIVIDVTGAVWIIGSHLWSTMMARVLAQRGYVVFCPDYRNFPQTTMEGMTLDVSDAIAWVLNNAERYNGDLNNVTLIGQSAGAHLTMMSLLSQAQLAAYQSNAEKGIHEGVPPPSDVAYNVPRYNPRESIQRYVGLSGMYNIEGLVDHFQAEGLNMPVLYQIAGGRDQVARYSVHAYFDDCRGGDTGETLPDNIFDFFPQRMFFIHGDADKCAPVGESASLVGMLRAAQDRYAMRRNARNDEARRHALRSRRLLPSPMAGEVKSSSATSAAATAGATSPSLLRFPDELDAPRGLDLGQRGVCTGGDLREEREQAGAASGVAAGAVDCDGGGSAEVLSDYVDDFTADRAYGGGTAAAAAAGAGAVASAGVRDAVAPYLCVAGQGGLLSPTTISPIIPASRVDRLQPAVELGFLVIPGGRHSDAFVDECIAEGRSCCVDFVCDYESAIDFQSSVSAPVSHGPGFDGGGGTAGGADGSFGGASVCAASFADKTPAWWGHAPESSVMPDAVLPLAVPYEDRSLPLRLCTLICPF